MNNDSSVEQEQWTDILRPSKQWFDLNLQELWRYRDLIKLFVHRDFVTNYKQTILGPFWFIIQPLVNSVVFTVIFGRVAKISTDGLPPLLFYMAGSELWAVFANCLNKTSGTLRSNVGMFGKVYFPRLTVPISAVCNNLIAFLLQFVFFLGFWVYFSVNKAPIQLNFWICYLPLMLLQIAMLGMGLGLIISALTIKYRDLTFLMGFIERLGMYATPVVYPLSIVPEKWQWVFWFNPMAAPIEMFRYAFLGQGQVPLAHLAVGWGISGMILFIGLILFHRAERNFIDMV